MVKQLLCFLLFSLSFSITAQNPNLRITLTGTPETCLNNGSLTWTTSGQDTGSTLVYSVFNNANNTVNSTTSSSTLSGLPAGSYRVVVTETIGSQSSQATSNNFAVLNQKVSLNFKATLVKNEICGKDGSFKVNVSSGRAPYRYELLNADNTPFLQQDSDTFTNLEAGRYKFRVIDNCGTGQAQEFEIKNTPGNIPNLNLVGEVLNCSTLKLKINLYNYEAVYQYPLQITATYTNPDTNVIENVSKDNILESNIEMNIPFFYTKPKLNINFKIIDQCGKEYLFNKDLNQSIDHTMYKLQTLCGQVYMEFRPSSYPESIIQAKLKINFISYPAGFNPNIANEKHDQYEFIHQYGNASQPLPLGTYAYTLTDGCRTSEIKYVTLEKEKFQLSSQPSNKCGTEFNTLLITPLNYTIFTIKGAVIAQAPQAFVDQFGALPFTIPSEWIYYDTQGYTSSIFIDNLPFGQYEIIAKATCNDEEASTIVNFTKPALIPKPVVTISQTCAGAFSYTSNDAVLGLQRFFPTVNGWGTTINNASADGLGKYSNSEIILANTLYFKEPGKYRIISSHIQRYTVRGDMGYYTSWCDAVIAKEFEIGKLLEFDDAYAFQCIDGSYDVGLNYTGNLSSIQYSIVDSESNAASTIKNNGNNPVFESLAAGIYFFRITDNCGNFTTRKMDIALLGEPGIRTKANCDTNELVLSIDNLDYLNFQWFKNDNPTTVLSTTNALNLGEFTTDKAGEYRVRITSNSPTSCINNTYNITLRPDALTNVEAGTGQVVNLNYDGAQSKINLFDYLTGVFDTYGTWTETTTLPSNLLANNEWLVRSAQAGTYTFKYTVSPLCDGVEKSSLVTINLAKVCYKPAILTGGGIEETKFGITLLGRAGADKDNWPMVRKGGWMALESNTKGFVVNRISFDTNNLPVGIPPANFVEGMMVFDTTNDCMKIYNGTVWSCFSTQTCPE